MAELIYRITGDPDALAEAKETLDVYVGNGVEDFNCTDRRGVTLTTEFDAGVTAGPQATTPLLACQGFVWIGQPMWSCDRCGEPAWEHQGLDQPPENPFSDAPSTVRPWKPGEAEAIRQKWERVVAAPAGQEHDDGD